MAIRWGIIGCGSVCEKKSGPALSKANHSQLVAVMRRDGRLAQDYARRHAVPRWYTDADALIDDPEVDAVYVATPPGNHLEYALRVCARGKPAYLEKPMGRNFAECRSMLGAFARAKVPLFVAYYRRALERFVRLKQLVDSGRLGVITSIAYSYCSPRHTARATDPLPWRLQAQHAGGGLFLDLGSHTLDLLDFLLGPLDGVHGTARNLGSPAEVENVVSMTFCVPGGALGMAEWNFAAHSSVDRLELRGTLGTLTCSTFGHEPLTLDTAAGAESLEFVVPEHIQLPLIQTVVDELKGLGKCPSTGESAARTSRVIDLVLAEYYGGRDDAFWQRPRSWPRNGT